MFPVGGGSDPSKDPEVSKEAGVLISLVALVCGLVLVGLTVSLWDDDTPGPLLAPLVLMDVAAVGIGIGGLVRRRG